MRVVAFNGSPRPKGNTYLTLSKVLSELEAEGIETELIQIGGTSLGGCVACYKCRETRDGRCAQDQDKLNQHLSRMLAADGILLGSPTYFADVTSEMKALIDRCGFAARSSGGLLRRKVGAAVVTARRAGAIHAFDTMLHFFLASEMVVSPSSRWNIAMGGGIGDVESDDEGNQIMRSLGQEMAWLLNKLHA